MHYVIAANFVRNMPWSPSWWAVVLSRALAARGRRVSVVVDGAECPEVFAETTLHIARPLRIHLGAHPGRFRALVRRVRESEPGSVVLSLSPMAAGDLWLPVEPGPLALARRLVRDLKPVSLVLELLHHPWLPFEAWAAATAGLSGPARLSFTRGPEPLPRVSTLTDAQVLGAHAAAPAMRASLGMAPDRLHAVMPAVEVVPRLLEPVFAGLAAAGVPLTLIVPTSRPHTVAGLAARAGLAGVVPLGLTASLPAIAAACDLAIAGPAAGQGESGGRWIADALRLGTPVLADVRARGVELVERHSGGLVVRGADGWAPALARAAEPAWRSGVRKALGAAAHALSLDPLLDRLESLAASAAMVGPRGRVPAANPPTAAQG